jgi:uncharacterized protein
MTMSGPILASTSAAVFAQPIGWPLCPQPDLNGQLQWPDLATSVRQRIEAILRTAPGEQLMHQEFGAGLETLLHQPNNSPVRAALRTHLMQHLAEYEPRIIVDQLDVDTGKTLTELLINIAYRLRTNGQTMVISARVPVGEGNA